MKNTIMVCLLEDCDGCNRIAAILDLSSLPQREDWGLVKKRKHEA